MRCLHKSQTLAILLRDHTSQSASRYCGLSIVSLSKAQELSHQDRFSAGGRDMRKWHFVHQCKRSRSFGQWLRTCDHGDCGNCYGSVCLCQILSQSGAIWRCRLSHSHCHGHSSHGEHTKSSAHRWVITVTPFKSCETNLNSCVKKCAADEWSIHPESKTQASILDLVIALKTQVKRVVTWWCQWIEAGWTQSQIGKHNETGTCIFGLYSMLRSIIKEAHTLTIWISLSMMIADHGAQAVPYLPHRLVFD